MKRSGVNIIAMFVIMFCMIGNLLYWMNVNVEMGLPWYARMVGILGMSGSIGLMLFFVWMGILYVIDSIWRI